MASTTTAIFEAGANALDDVFARICSVRSPFASYGRGPEVFANERASVAAVLSTSLKGERSEYVHQAKTLLALAQLESVCATELASTIETAGSEASLPELAAVVRQLSQMRTAGATELAELVRRSTADAAAQLTAQAEQLFLPLISRLAGQEWCGRQA